MIYTSYYGNMNNLQKQGFHRRQFVGISLNNYSSIQTEEKLCVNPVDFLNYKYHQMEWSDYRLHYLDKLYNLPKVWLDNLFDLYDDCVFLCYEQDNTRCHRKILMDFLNWYYVNCKGFSIFERGKGIICREL